MVLVGNKNRLANQDLVYCLILLLPLQTNIVKVEWVVKGKVAQCAVLCYIMLCYVMLLG